MLLVSGIVLGVAVRHGVARATTPYCDEEQWAEFVVLRRVQGSGALESQAIWGKLAYIQLRENDLYTFEQGPSDSGGIDLELVVDKGSGTGQ